MAKLTWNAEATESLIAKAQSYGEGVVSQEALVEIAEQLAAETGKDVTVRSVGSKLRKEGFEVQKANESVKSDWSEAEDAELVEFLHANPGEYTYADLSAAVAGGRFSAKQIQGKILSKELTHLVKKTEKAAATRTFTVEEEARFVNLVEAGKFIEDLATDLNRSVKQIRGKALSLLREGRIAAMPSQAESTAKEVKDVLEGLDLSELTVAEIAAKAGKTERGVRSMLSRRGIAAKDYDGAARRAKLDAKAEKAE